MTLLLNNQEVEQVLSMEKCLTALRSLYEELGRKEAVAFPRNDLHVPVVDSDSTEPTAHYLKTMGGASPGAGMAAVRLSSDICVWRDIDGKTRRLKIPAARGERWLGLILLFNSQNGELEAIMNDGYLSRMRVGGTNAIAADYMARKDAKVVALFGSGWQAGAQLLGLNCVRKLQEVRVFSPTAAHREGFAAVMSKQLGIFVRPVSRADEALEDADIVVTATNTRQPFFAADWLKKGMHLSCLQRDEAEEAAYSKCDTLVINTKSMEVNQTSSLLENQYDSFTIRDHPIPMNIDWNKLPTLGELVTGQVKGRTDDGKITGFINNLGLGAQFAAVGAKVLQMAKGKGLGRELDTEWFLEDVHP